MAETFETFIASERERLNKEREAIFDQRHELEGKLDAVNRELRAIEAYEAAKTGNAAPAARQARTTRRAQQARRGSRREQLLQVFLLDSPLGSLPQ
jgi:hypothetical protein